MASFLPWQVVHSDPGLWPSAHLWDEKPSHTISGRYLGICGFRTQKHKHLCINTTRKTIKLQKIQIFSLKAVHS